MVGAHPGEGLADLHLREAAEEGLRLREEDPHLGGGHPRPEEEAGPGLGDLRQEEDAALHDPHRDGGLAPQPGAGEIPPPAAPTPPANNFI